jgi:hypothetical protein
LSSTIIQNVVQTCQDRTSSTAYFYFDFNDGAQRRHDKLVRSLVLQLSGQDLEGQRKLEQLYSSCKHGQQQPTEGALVTILAELLANRNNVYILIDAIDECQPRDQLMEFIQTMMDWGSKSLHLLVTSRKERDIMDALECLVTNEICVETAEVNADIQVHIRERLQNDLKLRKWPHRSKLRSSKPFCKVPTECLLPSQASFQGNADH